MNVPRENLFTTFTKDWVYNNGYKIDILVNTENNKVTYRFIAKDGYKEDFDDLEDALFALNTYMLKNDDTGIIYLT